MNKHKRYVEAIGDCGAECLTKGKFYEVVKDYPVEAMWDILEDDLGESGNFWKWRFKDPVSEIPAKKQYVQAIETVSNIVAGNYYEITGERKSSQIWMIKDESGGSSAYSKERFKDPINQLPTTKLENVFIRVNGEAEKEAAVELLKSMGYVHSFYKWPQRTFMMAGDSEGIMRQVTNEWWNCAGFKELKVDKQTFMQPKTIFTLVKEKTYNVDGKELTRVEVEGIIQGMDIKMNCLRNMLGE